MKKCEKTSLSYFRRNFWIKGEIQIYQNLKQPNHPVKQEERGIFEILVISGVNLAGLSRATFRSEPVN